MTGVQLLIVSLMFASAAASAATARNCEQALSTTAAISHSSFAEVLEVMQRGAYNSDALPVVHIRMFKWVGNRLVFFVAQRSDEILRDTSDYRQVGVDKPIHPMGVGLTGLMQMQRSRWSGIFRGGEFPVIARASISQGNPFKLKADGSMQLRSTAMAIKVFSSSDPNQDVRTVNAVFQNNLNGLLGTDGQPLNYLESPQTNQPGLEFSKISKLYEAETLLGIAYASIVNSKDHSSRFPFINPQIRPVHSWAELGESDPRAVQTPVWVRIEPKLATKPISESDFRLEIYKTLMRDGQIVYELSAADQQDGAGHILWEKVGRIVFTGGILSAGVDQNLLFPHDALNSKFTGLDFEIPEPQTQFNSVPNDIQ